MPNPTHLILNPRDAGGQSPGKDIASAAKRSCFEAPRRGWLRRQATRNGDWKDLWILFTHFV
jgi:hypothetical protein